MTELTPVRDGVYRSLSSMIYLLWPVSFVMIVLFLWIASMNAYVLVLDLRGTVDPPSWFPLFGGLLGAIGLWLLPVEGSTQWAWCPLVLDYGCAPGLLFTAYRLVFRSPDR